MNIQQLIHDAHANAIDRGFYKCPKCGGSKYEIIFSNVPGYDPEQQSCGYCNGTGIDPHKNIGELLAMIAGELLGEAIDAQRSNRFADKEILNCCVEDLCIGVDSDWIHDFELAIKDSFEDEIADTFIRLFDLCGYFDIKITYIHDYVKINTDNIAHFFYDLIKFYLPSVIGLEVHRDVNHFYSALLDFCKQHNIDIEAHILAKMAYNKTRPEKHGEEY